MLGAELGKPPVQLVLNCSIALQVVSQGSDYGELAAEVRPYFTEATCEPGTVIIEVPSRRTRLGAS